MLEKDKKVKKEMVKKPKVKKAKKEEFDDFDLDKLVNLLQHADRIY